MVRAFSVFQFLIKSKIQLIKWFSRSVVCTIAFRMFNSLMCLHWNFFFQCLCNFSGKPLNTVCSVLIAKQNRNQQQHIWHWLWKRKNSFFSIVPKQNSSILFHRSSKIVSNGCYLSMSKQRFFSLLIFKIKCLLESRLRFFIWTRYLFVYSDFRRFPNWNKKITYRINGITHTLNIQYVKTKSCHLPNRL